jgi:hypothetical protein
LRKSTRPEFLNDALAPSWDVLQRITKNLWKFSEESSLRWIPSHQDDKTPIEQLPPDARLNVQADRLAGQFQQQSPHHQHDWDPRMIDSARCHLVINDDVIGSKHKRIARDVLREKAIFRYMQTSTNGQTPPPRGSTGPPTNKLSVPGDMHTATKAWPSHHLRFSTSSCTDGSQQEKWWHNKMRHYTPKSANPANIQ